MYRQFPLFQSHLDLAHQYWETLVKKGDCVIDATCGNGHDSLFLAKLALCPKSGHLYALDKQKAAIESSKENLANHLDPRVYQRIAFAEGCHSTFPNEIQPHSVKLIVYNLGYLPGGDKSKTTKLDSSLVSIRNAQKLIANGGAISITCYPGHPEGKVEEDALLEYSQSLDPKQWSCCHHRWTNRKNAPSLLLIQKQHAP